ncbi:DUF2889 domain-containing protein [Thalassospira profundimaris]|uniref:DUF2889 domain-containing protein n=1 Tax=Thalassospira profundimaris TaxID=502049 RepID=UPI000DEDFE6F|nr:DUF2889 domain-containing protein [Thalassospira profundimaris]
MLDFPFSARLFPPYVIYKYTIRPDLYSITGRDFMKNHVSVYKAILIQNPGWERVCHAGRDKWKNLYADQTVYVMAVFSKVGGTQVMPLPESVSRTHHHVRRFAFDSFSRTDGLWDLEGRLTDSKTFDYYDLRRGKIDPGGFIHDIAVRVTIDEEMTVRDIVASLDAAPFRLCQGGGANLSALVGQNLAKGWRKHVNEALAGASGCAHIREMLLAIPTVAFQTLGTVWENRDRPEGMNTHTLTERPFYLGGCSALAPDGAVVKTHYPQFFESDS